MEKKTKVKDTKQDALNKTVEKSIVIEKSDIKSTVVDNIDNDIKKTKLIEKNREKPTTVERSLITTYRKRIWGKFTQGINEFKLVNDGDRIAVCISGGKDSFILAKCFQELLKHGKQNFELKFIVMNPGYVDGNIEIVKENLKKLKIEATIFESDIFKVVQEMEGSPCYVCARMRRGNLYAFAKSLGCNKIALGHHLNDVCETTLMSMFYNGKVQTMMPKLNATNFKGMELIRPLYLVEEEAIKNFWKTNGFSFINCACPLMGAACDIVASNDGCDDEGGKRKQTKALIKRLMERNPNLMKNILSSMKNVNLDTVLGWQRKGKKVDFLDEYEEM
jgi:tRNA(Ile)-lysidine synthase TilS/MesJ